MMVSVFKDIYSHEPFEQTVEAIIKRFKEDDRYKISTISALSKEDRDQAKKALPIVTFAGTFKKRAKGALKVSSGLLVLDFDNVDVSKTKDILSKDQFCYAAFASPSGKGVKALIKIKPVKNDAEYKKYYAVFSKKYKLDESGKDISRACFFCYDPDLYLNSKATSFELKEEKPKIDPVRNDYSIANKACEIIRHAREGERHTKILKASRLLGGFVASKLITFTEAKRLLLQEADNVNPNDLRDNLNAVTDGLNNGMNEPLSKDQLHAELESEQNLIRYGKIYYTLGDKREEILDLFANGQQRGFEIGLDVIDKHYTCKLGTTTYIYGAPYSGKTQFWFWYLIGLSKASQLKHAIFSPETGEAKEIFAELVQMVAEKDFYQTYGKQMTDEERDNAMNFVDQHFIIIDPSHKIITHTDFFNYLDEIERVYNTKIHTATIDPFNEFRQDLRKYSNRQDLYLEAVLSEVRENARTNNRHNCIITHVQDQQIKEVKGIRYYPLPTYREIAGGQAWSRKGMSMIAVWRPKEGLCDENGMPYESNAVIIDIQKSKPKGTGRIGKVLLSYNVNKHTYEDLEGNQRIDTQNPIQVNHTYSNIDNITSNEPPF